MRASSLLRSPRGQLAGLHERVEQDLDVDFDVRGVDAGGVVDEVGVEPAAGQRVLDAAALREAEVAAFADDLGAQLRAVDADARRWRGRRPRRWIRRLAFTYVPMPPFHSRSTGMLQDRADDLVGRAAAVASMPSSARASARQRDGLGACAGKRRRRVEICLRS